MSTSLNNRTEALNQRLQNRQQGMQSNVNNRATNMRANLNARDSRKMEELVSDLASLNPNPSPPTLRKEEPRGGIPAARGYAERAYQPGNDTGTAGIASPLIEGATPPEADPGNPGAPTADKPKLEREYYPVAAIPSSDGIFTLSIRPLKRIALRDANGGQVVIQLAAPEELTAPEVSE